MSYHESSKTINKSKKFPYLDIPVIIAVFTLPIDAICKAVLLCILCHQKHGKYKHFPALYKEVGCGESSVKKALRSLVDKGYLIREQRGQYLIAFGSEQGAWLNLSYFQSVSTTRMGYVKKLVLFSLSKYMNQEELECYPKIETISKACSLSPKTVSKTLSELVAQRVIKRFKRNGKWHIKAMLKAMREDRKATSDVSNHGIKAISGGVCKNNNNIKKYNKKQQSSSLQNEFNFYKKKKNIEGGEYYEEDKKQQEKQKGTSSTKHKSPKMSDEEFEKKMAEWFKDD
jgi:DNA-binding transcriptional regulator YhcF (GntR family)/biotin operon repressor